MIHLVMEAREQDLSLNGDTIVRNIAGCDVVGAFSRQESAHLDAEVRSLLPEPGINHYVSSMSVNWCVNEEGTEFDEGLPEYTESEVFLVVEIGNPILAGRIPVGAFSSQDGADEMAERQNLYAQTGGIHKVVRMKVDASQLLPL